MKNKQHKTTSTRKEKRKEQKLVGCNILSQTVNLVQTERRGER